MWRYTTPSDPEIYYSRFHFLQPFVKHSYNYKFIATAELRSRITIKVVQKYVRRKFNLANTLNEITFDECPLGNLFRSDFHSIQNIPNTKRCFSSVLVVLSWIFFSYKIAWKFITNKIIFVWVSDYEFIKLSSCIWNRLIQ